MEYTCKPTIEMLRKDALEHYEKLATESHHWSSFVVKAIENYMPLEDEEARYLKRKKILEGFTPEFKLFGATTDPFENIDKSKFAMLVPKGMNLDKPTTVQWPRDYGKEYWDRKNAEPNDLSILQSETYKDAFPNLSDQEILWSQHQIILKQKKEIAELRDMLYGHNTSLHGGY